MSKFLLRLILFFFSILIADRVIGTCIEQFYHHISTGRVGKDNYICDYCAEDILIFGSSRAEMHYNAKMIEDSLSMSAFNCGAAGYGIYLSYVYLKEILKRHCPKIVILEVTPFFDLEKGDDYVFTRNMKPHYDKEFMREMLLMIEPNEKYKMCSMLYQYNSNAVHTPSSVLQQKPFSRFTIGQNGFIPETGKHIGREAYLEYSPDMRRINCFREFIKALDLNKTKLICIVSPYYYGFDDKRFDKCKEICDEYKVPFVNYSRDPRYLYNDNKFSASMHLNAKEANEFTKEIIYLLKKEL